MNSSLREIIESITKNDKKTLKRLLDNNLQWKNAHINNEHETLLHSAVFNGNYSVVLLLLKEKLDPNAANIFKETPLHLACQMGNLEIAKVLIAYHASINNQDTNGWTSLHKAMLSENVDVAECLLSFGAEINTKDNYGNTPMHIAIEENNRNAVLCLLHHNADTQITNGQGLQVVHLATLKDNSEILGCLAESGADLFSPNEAGESALRIAIKRDSSNCVKILAMNGVPIEESDLMFALEKALIKMWQFLKSLKDQQENHTLYETTHDIANDTSQNIENYETRDSKLLNNNNGRHSEMQTNHIRQSIYSPRQEKPRIQELLEENQRLKQRVNELEMLNAENNGFRQILVDDIKFLQATSAKLREKTYNGRLSTEKQDSLLGTIGALDKWIDSLSAKSRDSRSLQALNSDSNQSQKSLYFSQRSAYEIDLKDLEIREKIGMGSYATVFRGVYKGVQVAVKKFFLNPNTKTQLLESFWKEVNIMRKIRYPKIVLFIGPAISEDHLFIITEYMPMRSLDSILHNNKSNLPVKKKVAIALDIVKGMLYLHEFNPPIWHRDLKTANCLCDEQLNVKIADFGMAKMHDNNHNTTSIATIKYMAPEFISKQIFTDKSDIFSFGMVLWEIFAGKEPFEGLNPTQSLFAIVDNRRPVIPADVPQPIRDCINISWSAEAEKRPSFREILTTLDNFYNTL